MQRPQLRDEQTKRSKSQYTTNKMLIRQLILNQSWDWAILGILTPVKQTADLRSGSPSSMTVRKNGEFHWEMPATRTWHHKYLTRLLRISSLGGNFFSARSMSRMMMKELWMCHTLIWVHDITAKEKAALWKLMQKSLTHYGKTLLSFSWQKPTFFSFNPRKIKLKYTQTFL